MPSNICLDWSHRKHHPLTMPPNISLIIIMAPDIAVILLPAQVRKATSTGTGRRCCGWSSRWGWRAAWGDSWPRRFSANWRQRPRSPLCSSGVVGARCAWHDWPSSSETSTSGNSERQRRASLFLSPRMTRLWHITWRPAWELGVGEGARSFPSERITRLGHITWRPAGDAVGGWGVEAGVREQLVLLLTDH